MAIGQLISLGSAHAGHEVLLFQRHLAKLMSHAAILVAPSEDAGAFVSDQLCAQHFWIDPPTMGDVLGG